MDQNQTAEQPKGSVLQKYYRQPKVYLELPSKGNFYADGALDRSEDGKYAVYAMTAKDELMYKTPDALMSGQSTVEVIQSCIPSIKDAWKMPSIDLDACLVAIRIATYGEELEVTANCTSCGHENEYNLSLTAYLGNISQFDYKDTIVIDDLTVHIRPYSYREITKTAIKNIEQQKIFDIVNSESMSDEEKLERFGASFVKLTELSIDMIAGCITEIETPEGSEKDSNTIKEFISNAPKEIFDAIYGRLEQMKTDLDFKIRQVECAECHSKFDVNITLDQSNFFAARS